MRLHRLRVTAFGPFSGTEEVDFDRLSDAGLFLVHGQTGAGKTSILDAVCFALYGRVPGARRAAAATRGALRSDHAAPDVPARVELETTIRGRRWKVTRSPAWDRPKLRGQGTTPQNEKVVLEELVDGVWKAHTTRLDEAGDLLGRVLGMNVDQFCQVAMLPQGAFATFLRAGAEERRQVLEKLFATEIFTQVEKWLEAHRAETRRAAEGLQAAAESTADRISEVVQAPRPVSDFVAVGEAWATEAAGQQEALREVTAVLAEEAAASVRRARETLDRDRALAERQRRHAEALRRSDLLAERRPERDRLAARLDLAARADRVVPLIRSATDRARRCEQAARRVEQARAAVAELVPGEAPEDVLRKAERERLDQVAGLERLAGDARRLAELRAEIAKDERHARALAGEREQIAEALDVLPGRVEELCAELEAVRVRTAGREGAVTLADEAARRLEDARLRDRLIGELATARDEHRAAIDVEQSARERWLDLRRIRLDAMAATLADDLRKGEPCMVCGSLDHPAPASTLGVVPGEADEEKAEAAAEKARQVRERTDRRVTELTARLDGARERAGDRTVEALALELRAAEAELNDIDAVATRAEPLTGEIKKLDDLLTQARDRHARVIEEESAARTRQAEAGAEVERLTVRLDEARGDDPTLDARRRRLTGEAAALSTAADAVRDADLAEDELAAARKQASAAAEAESFASLDKAREAALAESERTTLTARLRSFDDEQASVRELLDDPELAHAAALPAPDLASAEAALAAAEAVHAAASHALDRATHRRDRLADLRAALARQIAEWRPAAERHATAARLAGIAGGDPSHNTERTRLSAYVLAHRLVQVVAAANERLHQMSDGRYALRHTVDRTAGESRRHGTGGLGLRVTDAWTGQERDPATLSGGESFISSLALALGLADVVTSEAGGTEIGTLFVDEGFGTLDEQTLDEVMEVLDGLRDGGRAVGIVSHVAELRSRIPAQLQVSKSRSGSHTRVAA